MPGKAIATHCAPASAVDHAAATPVVELLLSVPTDQHAPEVTLGLGDASELPAASNMPALSSALPPSHAFDASAISDFFAIAMPQYTPDQIVEVAEIPRNRLGKVARETLREHLRAITGLGTQ